MIPIATDTAFYVAFTCVAIPLGGGLAAGWTANHGPDIARSWTDGCEQLATWRDQITTAAWPLLLAAELRLLALILPATGQHRAKAVTS